MTGHTRIRDRIRAAVAAAAAHRPVRAVVGAILAPGALLAGVHVAGGAWEAYVLEAGVVLAVVLGAIIGWASMQDGPNIVPLAIDGQIDRDVPSFAEQRVDADDLAATIEDLQEAHEDDDKPTQALLVEIDSPGGPVGASSELHEALAEFDGPSVAYVQDVCASGGYLAAAACDRIIAREHSIVGSIGVIGSQLNYHALLADHGVTYEEYTAGDLKDAGHPAAETDDREREYRQGLIDAYMDQFVERVADCRADLDAAAIRELEAGVFLGEGALDAGLIDGLGDEEDAREWLAGELDLDIDDTDDLDVNTRRSLRPTTGRPAAQRLAYAAGQGVASVLADQLPDPDLNLEFRYRQ